MARAPVSTNPAPVVPSKTGSRQEEKAERVARYGHAATARRTFPTVLNATSSHAESSIRNCSSPILAIRGIGTDMNWWKAPGSSKAETSWTIFSIKRNAGSVRPAEALCISITIGVRNVERPSRSSRADPSGETRAAVQPDLAQSCTDLQRTIRRRKIQYTIGQLAELCSLSRSTLLYYSNQGLLTPTSRTQAGYRIYSEEDRTRLEKILAFRSLGLELKKIKDLLELENRRPVGVLLKRIFQINDNIAALRKQQKAILEILEVDQSLRVGKSAVESFLESAADKGLSRSNYKRIHATFEACSPTEHRRLLKLLGFSESDSRELMEDIANLA